MKNLQVFSLTFDNKSYKYMACFFICDYLFKNVKKCETKHIQPLKNVIDLYFLNEIYLIKIFFFQVVYNAITGCKIKNKKMFNCYLKNISWQMVTKILTPKCSNQIGKNKSI